MKKLSYLLFSCLFLLACEKQETEPELTFEVLFELENTALTGTEAEFRGKFLLSGSFTGVKMEEFGAVLTERESNASSTILLMEREQTAAEQVFLLDSLSIDKSYEIYLYTRSGEQEWKSEPLAFTTATPEVHSISSLSAAPGDVLLIKGSSLPLNLKSVSVTFGELPAKVLRGGLDSLQVEVPALDFEARSITVSFDSYSHTFEEPFVRNPWKEYRVSVEGGASEFLFSINKKAYFAVGRGTYRVEDNLWVFDSEAKTFIQKADLPMEAGRVKSATLNDKGYGVFTAPKGTGKDYNELYGYTPETDTWQLKEQLHAPFRYFYSSLFSGNGLLYFWRGYDWDLKETYQDFYSYDVETDTYTELATSEKSISGPFFEHAGFLYAVDKESRKILGFNAANKTWDELFSCPEEVTSPAFLPFKDRVYVFSFELGKTWSYYLADGSWKEEPAALAPPESLDSWSAFMLDNKGYFLNHGVKPLVIWEFSPE